MYAKTWYTKSMWCKWRHQPPGSGHSLYSLNAPETVYLERLPFGSNSRRSIVNGQSHGPEFLKFSWGLDAAEWEAQLRTGYRWICMCLMACDVFIAELHDAPWTVCLASTLLWVIEHGGKFRDLWTLESWCGKLHDQNSDVCSRRSWNDVRSCHEEQKSVTPNSIIHVSHACRGRTSVKNVQKEVRYPFLRVALTDCRIKLHNYFLWNSASVVLIAVRQETL